MIMAASSIGIGTQQSSEQYMEQILLTDSCRSFTKMSIIITQAVQNSDLTIQEVERKLRETNCFTHLIARKRNASFGEQVTFQYPPGTHRTYYLMISTKDPDEATKEVLQESATCKENFEKLNDTGFVTLDDSAAISDQISSGTIIEI